MKPDAALPTMTALPAMPSGGSMLLSLSIVVLLIPLALWLLRRIGSVGAGATAGMRVVGQLPLGPRERLVAVEAGDRCLLLAVGPAGVQRVGTMPLPVAAAGGGAPPAADFAALLRRLGVRGPGR